MIYKGDLLLFSSVYNKKALKNVKGDVDVQKEFLYVYRTKKKNPGRWTFQTMYKLT